MSSERFELLPGQPAYEYLKERKPQCLETAVRQQIDYVVIEVGNIPPIRTLVLFPDLKKPDNVDHTDERWNHFDRPRIGDDLICVLDGNFYIEQRRQDEYDPK